VVGFRLDLLPTTKMSPRQQIANLYWRNPQPRTFDTDEYLHRVTGYVIEGDDYFLMGRGVDSSYGAEFILNPAVAFPRSRQDMWFVWAYCGPLGKIHELCPYPLPLIGWVRHGQRLRIYDFQDMWNRCASKHMTFTIGANRTA
jgi:hypothetical protein